MHWPAVRRWLPYLAVFLIVAALWLPFGLRGPGLVEEWDVLALLDRGYQLAFVADFQGTPIFSLRPLIFLPQVLTYLITPDSFVGVNVLTICVLTLEASFAYSILTSLAVPAFAALPASILFVIYPSNEGLFSFRIFPVQFAILTYLISIYFLISYWTTHRVWCLIPMWAALAVSLLIYEIAFPLALVQPIILILLGRGLSRRMIAIAGLWYIVPLAVITRDLVVITSQAVTYEGQIAQSELSAKAIVGVDHALLEVYRRLFFASWWEAILRVQAGGPFLIIACISGLLAGASIWVVGRPGNQLERTTCKASWSWFAAGLAIVTIGFGVYVLSASHRVQYLQTLLLSSSGAAIALVFGQAIVAKTLRLGLWLPTAGASAFVALATLHGLYQHAKYLDLGRSQQNLLGQILERVPNVQDGTLIAVLDEAGRLDNVWTFNWSARLTAAIDYMYANSTIEAAICGPEGQREPAGFIERCVFDSDELVVEQVTAPDGPQVRHAYPYSRTAVLRYDNDGAVTLEQVGDSAAPAEAATSPARERSARRAQNYFDCWPIESCTTVLPPTADNVFVRLTRPFLGHGWENIGETDDSAALLPFRWMVAPNATVVVHLANPKSYAVEFHIATAIAPDQLAGLQLSANGSAVPIVLTPDGSGGATGRAVIPADSVAAPRGSTELRFSVPYLKAPAGSAQPLGLAFDWLKIAPTSGGEPTA